MEPLAHSMTPEQQISENDNNVACSDSVVLLLPTPEQDPKSFFIVMFALFHLPVTHTGKERFTSIGRIQHNETKEPMCLGAFTFKFCPCGVSGADCAGLEDTQEAGAADGHTRSHPVKIENKFASDIIKEIFQIKSCHCLGTPLGSRARVGSNQVLEHPICGSHPAPSRVKEEIMVEKGEISSDCESCL